jgi:HNH endonuclease
MKVTCSYCGNELERIPSRAKRRCFCSKSHQLLFGYQNGLLDPKAITAKAHATLRERGHYKRDNSYLHARNPATLPEARAKISAAKLEHNWMRGRMGKLHQNWQGGKIWWRGKEWDTTKLRARRRDAFMCTECDMPEWRHVELLGHPLHVHHIVAYRISHDNSMQNLQTLCDYCHGRKKREENIIIEQCRDLLSVAA